MQSLAIHKLAVKYRLANSDAAERARLDRILSDVLEDALEEALARAGIPADEEICIRHIYAQVRLQLKRTDRALSTAWSGALAGEIKRAVEGGHVAGVLHYQSRAQALIEMAVGVSLYDTSRAWAWKQLEMWRAGEAASDSEALHELLGALVSTPRMIVPVLRELARRRLLARLTQRLTLGDWTALSQSALNAADTSLSLQDVALGESQSGQTPASQFVQSSTVDERRAARISPARRLIGSSALAQAFSSPTAFSSSIDESARLSGIAAVLLILEAEPSAFRRDAKDALGWVRAVASELRVSWAHAQRLASSREGSAVAPETAETLSADARDADGASLDALAQHSADGAHPASARQRGDAGHMKDARGDDVEAGHERAGRDEEFERDGAERWQESEREHAALFVSPERQDEVVADEVVADERLVRRRGLTRFGGLLFLLGVVEDLELVEEMLAHVALSGRSFRWMMHRLALNLLAVEPSDAAALAFAGLLPDEEPPSLKDDAPSEAEELMFSGFTARIRDELSRRLEDVKERTPDLLGFVCQRRAEIVADPGWIDVRMSLDEVSTEIRRAGLDLNPGYVAWLGVVLRFVYE